MKKSVMVVFCGIKSKSDPNSMLCSRLHTSCMYYFYMLYNGHHISPPWHMFSSNPHQSDKWVNNNQVEKMKWNKCLESNKTNTQLILEPTWHNWKKSSLSLWSNFLQFFIKISSWSTTTLGKMKKQKLSSEDNNPKHTSMYVEMEINELAWPLN